MPNREDTRSIVFLKVKSIQESLGRSEPLDGEMNLIDNGLLDSFGLLSLVSELEHTFSIQFDDTELLSDEFSSINTISTLIDRKLK